MNWIPVPLRLALLAIFATVFYGYVGQLVPQKEVHPPQVVEIAKDVGPQEMVAIGKEIFEGKGICGTCHTIGKSGALRFPDLEGIGTRAASRKAGYTAVDYLAESLYEPEVYIVEGFSGGMPVINKPPVSLTDDEILTVIAYLQSLGSTPSVTMETKLVYTGGSLGGGDGAPDAEDLDPEDIESGQAILAAAGEGAAPSDLEPAGDTGSASGGPSGPLVSFGCTDCHFVDQPGNFKGPSLYDVGARLSARDIVAATSAHEDPLPNAADLTLADLQSLAETLSQRKGQG